MKILWCKKELEQAVRIAGSNCEKLNIQMKPDVETLVAHLPYAEHNSFFMGIMINFVKYDDDTVQAYFYVPARVAKDPSDTEVMQSVFEDTSIIGGSSSWH